MLKTMPTTFAELRTALDYLPVAVRAADRNPGNPMLWAEAVRAQRAVIDYADTHLDESEAAEVQNQVGRIGHFAIVNARTQYGTGHAATYSQRAKRRILILTGAIDSYADMTEREVRAYLDANVSPGAFPDLFNTNALVKELRRRGTVTEDVFWWLVDQARTGRL